MDMLPRGSNIISLLQRVPILERLDIQQLRVLATKFHLYSVNEGTVIIKEGDPGKDLFIIVSGEVLVTKATVYGPKKLAKLGPTDFFGEIALLKNMLRTASVTASTACMLLTLDQHSFLDLYQFLPPETRDDIQIIIAKRLAEQS